MARKQFVSSKKNAPSRAVSSKEAALRSRDPESVGDEDDEDVGSEADDASMNGGGDSPMSSVASSAISSDDDGGDDAEDDNDVAENGDDEVAAALAVQVMPASVGRGKQLRFPTAISRGKEARILHNGSDRDNSDSESYASLASDEEEEPDEDMQGTSQEAPVAVTQEATTSPSRSPLLEEEEVTYPIKAIRARKRHRPDSGYFAHMSTHVRDCLLSIRDVGTAEALSEDAHRDFRRKLSAGTVERVPWKQVSPPPPAAAPTESEKKVPKSFHDQGSERRHSSKEDKESKSSKSSSRKNGDGRRSEKSSRGDGDSSESRKKDRSGKENDSRRSRRDEKDSKRSSDKKDSKESSERSKSSHSKSSSSKRAEANGNGVDRPELEDPVCAKCKKSVKEQNAEEEKRKAALEASAAAAELQAKAAQAQLEAAAAAKAQAQAAQAQAAAPTVTPVPVGSFVVPTNSNRDIAQMREKAARLNDEARSLKHEGNRHGTADPGPDGQAAQGRYYLRSSAKFFQHALLLADIKAAYREAGDERHARTYGDFSVQTLAQTSSLIESTVRKLRGAGNRRLVALGYKLASIVELTIYRLQHVKLFSLYSDLYTPGRSPDTRQNGTTPPINGTGTDSQESAVKALLLKEMEHTLRGFDMWQRYEACRIDVLPRVTNPAVVDLTVLFEDLHTELGQS